MTPEPTRPPVWWYRIVTTLLVVGVAYLVISGRLAQSLGAFRSARRDIPTNEFDRIFLTNVLWIASIFPFLGTAHWLVTRRRAERSLASYWSAAKTIVLVAARGAAPRTEDIVDEVEPPDDDQWSAILKGAGIAIAVPAFFWFSPAHIPHTPRVAVWLSVSGLLMGCSVYCVERARPHLDRDWLARQSGRFFAKTYTVNPSNYAGPGKRWITFYWVSAILMMIAWLAGGAVALGR